jgi:acyl-CoA dehydrogenase
MDGTMTTEPTAEQVRSEIRAWLEANWRPTYGLIEWRGKLVDAGWAAPGWPKDSLGRDYSPALVAVVEEEMRRAGAVGPARAGPRNLASATLLEHGDEAQKARFLRRILTGEDSWCQLFSEPGNGSDLAGAITRADLNDGRYVVNGQKVWTSRAEHSDLMLLLARTTPREQAAKRTDGLSVFVVDMRAALGKGLSISPIRTMINHATTEVFFDNLEVPAENLVGEEGKGFRYILDGMNAERILISSECIGDARWFIEKASSYAKERVVFGRPIGQNQGIQFPIARAYAQTEAADLMVKRAAALYEQGKPAGEQANLAKLLAADASWAAADMCLQTHGGFGFAEEYDIERKFRETRLYQIAPISTNLILSYVAEHVLGLPRSY